MAADDDKLVNIGVDLLPFYSPERGFLFQNLFHGSKIPETSAFFFEPDDRPREEIKGADITVNGSDKPWQIIYGEVLVGGVISLITTDVPGGGKWLHMVTTIAGHECEALLEMRANNEEVTFGTSGGNIDGWSNGDWAFVPPESNAYVFVSFSSGNVDQVANADLVAQSAALFPGVWTSNHRQRGRAHVYNILYYSFEKFPEPGLPNIQFLVRGDNQVYDPRDTTYKYTNNAALLIAHFLTNSDYGYGASYDTDINIDNLIEAANICDETVTLADTSTEARYTINGVFDVSQTPDNILSELGECIGGPIVYRAGQWFIYPAEWKTPTLELDENDIVQIDTVRVGLDKARAFNAVKGTFLSPEHDWEIVDFPAVTNALYESQDGERIYSDVTYPFITSSATAQRLSKIKLERIRQAIEVQATFTLKAFQAQVYDNVLLTLTRFGWDEKPFEVLDTQLVLSGGAVGVQMQLRETAEAIYDWNDGEETTVDLAPNTTLPLPTHVTSPTNLSLRSDSEDLYIRNDGTIFSRLRVSWDAFIDPFILNGGRVEIQKKDTTAGDANYTIGGVATGDINEFFILDVKESHNYNIRIRAVNSIGFKSAWVSAEHVVTGKEQPPSVVTGLIGTPREFGVLFSWSAISDKDISHYLLSYGEDRQNLLTYSEAFDNAAWTKTRASITANDIASPDSLVTADKLVESNAASNDHYLEQIGKTVVSGNKYRVSVFAKADERTKLKVVTHINGFPGNYGAIFDLDNGDIDSEIGTIESPLISNIGNDWYLCEFVVTSDENHVDTGILIKLVNASGTDIYNGDGSSGLHVWGASFQNSPNSNEIYVKTEASAITAATRTQIAEVRATEYAWNVQDADTYDIQLIAVDTSGNKSITYTKAEVIIAAPSVPQTLVGTIIGPDLLLTWAKPATTQFEITEYQIKEESVIVATIKGTSYKQRVDWEGDHTFEILAVDVAGNIGSAASTDVSIVAPGAVSDIEPTIVHSNVLLQFEEPSSLTLPIDYYLIKRGATLGAAVLVAQVSKSFVQLLETSGGEKTYWIIPVDTAGNEGTEASVTLLVGKPPNYTLHADQGLSADDGDTITNILCIN